MENNLTIISSNISKTDTMTDIQNLTKQILAKHIREQISRQHKFVVVNLSEFVCVCVCSSKGFGVGVHDWHTMQMCGQQMPSGESGVGWWREGMRGGHPTNPPHPPRKTRLLV